MPLWFVITMTLNPFDFKRRNAWGTPGKIFTCFGWELVGCFFLLEKHHALFAESDEDIFCFPFFQQRFASALQIRILGRNNIRIAAENTCREKSFSAVRLDDCQAPPLDQITGIGIRSDDLAA